MHITGYLIEVIIILLAAVVCLWLAQRLKLASVLGYLVAGIVIGPTALGLITDVEAMRPLAELGVVFLLFTVGLELPIERIRVIRPAMFGLSAAQIVLTAAVITAIAWAAGGSIDIALVAAGALSLSSTAIVLQLLTERRELTSRNGRSALTVLLSQDLAVGPLLVIVVALGQKTESLPMVLGLAGLKAVAALIVILVVGRLILRPLFRPVAATRDPEIFAALTLLVVLCTGLATQMAGLSMAFGAFLTGMLLAETTYRHQVAAVILPFRGLLLGLFFIIVGVSIDLDLAWAEAPTVAGLLALLLVGKALLLIGLGLVFRLPLSQALYLGILLCQGGEFAFVLLGAGIVEGVLPRPLGQMLALIVILSMILTPLLAIAARRVLQWTERPSDVPTEPPGTAPEDLNDHVIVVGYGRVGSTIAAHLSVENVACVAIERDPEQVAQGHKEGRSVYYGDATRPEVLTAFSVDRARALIITLPDPAQSLQIVSLLRYIFPDLKILARAHDTAHGAELMKAGADGSVPEIADGALKLAASVLQTDGKQ
jgi:CPA2 family monovalent cation:H+ antiporter-2